MTVAAIVGCAGLAPVMAAVERGGTIALANKEALVSAGEVLMQAVAKHGATLLPTDSEHNAIFQCLNGNRIEDVAKITLTASGGPLRTWSQAQLDAATPAEAVAHPNWSMGAKISVDSATMMNKGLEYIEAYHLFPVGLDRLGIVIHPQSVIHSMVEFRDRSTLAQRVFQSETGVLQLAAGLERGQRAFQMATQLAFLEQGAELQRLAAGAGLSSDQARALARIGLANYFAGALVLPYTAFLRAAEGHHYDIDRLGQQFGVGFETVCHRLSTLQRPSARGVPFFFIRVDRAGNIS